jgi:hypothetical protein
MPGADAYAFLRCLANYILPLLAPHIRYWSTPKRAALVRDPKFTDRVVAETRALLATIPT